MIQFIYNPAIINSFISTAYCATGDLVKDENSIIQKLLDIVYYRYPWNSRTTFVHGSNKDYLFYLVFDTKQNKWLFYHRNPFWEKTKTIKSVMHMNDIKEYVESLIYCDTIVKTYQYMGFIVQNENNIDIINIINQEGNSIIANEIYPIGISYVDFDNKTYHLNGTNPFFQNYSDMIIPTRTGLVHINPKSDVEMLLSVMRIGKSQSHVRDLVNVLVSKEYADNMQVVFYKLKMRFERIQSMRPKIEYSKIYQLFDEHDKEYYNMKMKTFQKSIIDTFQQAKNVFSLCSNNNDMGIFVSDFVNSFKFDLAFELSIVYHRLRHFPQERVKLYRKYPNHPYVKLLKMIQDIYVKNHKRSRNFINVDIISKMLEKDNMIINDEFSEIIIQAVSRRSELFVYMYNLYLESVSKNVKPKYKTKYNYFPFKIFSPTLFAMDHMLNIPEILLVPDTN
ncbi:hypothetical protein QJ857_gp0610 [Tupanvirus soda lake]|uniref:Uncharacterized protein n=2 Tax=Tupanvirus TaxID=2094720 RepID=A0A6N1NVV2_9VIRU|nr:hypothetical protein QJ857_gp0610 [Tupanvirus soda lake]QKU35433.1 hypothetical protein [Tupanvirus soda lake]